MSAHTSHRENSASTAQAKLNGASHDATVTVCSECRGTGVVRLWSEFAFFEDMRACSRCDEGDRIEAVIAEIMKRDAR